MSCGFNIADLNVCNHAFEITFKLSQFNKEVIFHCQYVLIDIFLSMIHGSREFQDSIQLHPIRARDNSTVMVPEWKEDLVQYLKSTWILHGLSISEIAKFKTTWKLKMYSGKNRAVTLSKPDTLSFETKQQPLSTKTNKKAAKWFTLNKVNFKD